VTPEYAKAVGADAIIAALGARPIKPDIPGIDGDNVLLADDAYIAPERVGSSAVILGGGFVGMELAIYLHMLGRQVEVVEMAETINSFPNVLHGNAISIKMQEDGIEAHFSEKAVKIDRGGVWCQTADGEKYYTADTVIYAVGQKSLAQEAMALYDCAGRVYPVGDCVLPRNIAEANVAARSIAEDIGRF
jgi:pyruvate/2-oxoglutarate dehydrogenase complex dihydrolipoamide dehydrogenase (E3) component